MENERYLKDLSEIKNMMSRSSKFISLSGLAGVFAGGYALMGAIIAMWLLEGNVSPFSLPDLSGSVNFLSSSIITSLVLIAIIVLVLAIGTAVYLTTRKAHKNEQQIWDTTSRRLIINFFAPLFAGGIFCLVLLQYGLIGLIAPSMLLFYGLALVHASKYTFGDLKSLGYAIVTLGLIATQFMEYGLYFWAVGFGIFHIIYGIWMYNKYDRNKA